MTEVLTTLSDVSQVLTTVVTYNPQARKKHSEMRNKFTQFKNKARKEKKRETKETRQ